MEPDPRCRDHKDDDPTQKETAMAENMSSNPITRALYTADPAPMVYGDTLYLYTTHDENELIHDFYTMFDWRCFSTKDMV